jgi:hypothetical protein
MSKDYDLPSSLNEEIRDLASKVIGLKEAKDQS